MDSKLAEYARLLEAWPGVVGRGESAAALVEDCLALTPMLDGSERLIDIGAGGGMPGIPLAISLPNLRVTLLEADRAKSAFLISTLAQLGLGHVEVVAERAEVAGHEPALREAFDVAACRALASMPVLAELCLPFVRVGGRLLAMKGRVEDAAEAITRLGGDRVEVVPAATRLRRDGQVAVVRKVGPTPGAYPRRPGVPARRPLGA